MYQKQIIIHVGAHKTASTYLQKRFFPELKDIYFTGNHSANIKNNCCFYPLDQLIRSGEPLFNWQETKNNLYQNLYTIEEETILYSQERLMGRNIIAYNNNPIITNLLADIFPDAKIIFVFRKQDDWVESVYIEEILKRNVNLKIEYFIGIKKNNIFARTDFLDVRHLCWDKFLLNYRQIFGDDNVLALPYEMFKLKPDVFFDYLTSFIGTDSFYPEKQVIENKSHSLLTIKYQYYIRKIKDNKQLKESKLKQHLKLIDKSINHSIENISNKFGKKPEIISPKHKQQILSLHKESNKKLSEIIDIDLSQYNYY